MPAYSPRIRLLAAIALAVLPAASWAANKTWTGTTGNWSDGINWSGGTPPTAGDMIFLTQIDSASRNVTLDSAASATGLGNLVIDTPTAGIMVLTQALNSLQVTGNETLGNTGYGTLVQSGGTNSAGASLYVGFSPASHGTYQFSGGSLSAGTIYVGLLGGGSLSQTAGTATVASQVYVGYSVFGNGTYSLSGSGVLLCAGLQIGPGGNGTMIQTGGTASISGQCSIGSTQGGTGVYLLSGSGSLTLGGLNVVTSKSTLVQSGGMLSASSNATLESAGVMSLQSDLGAAGALPHVLVSAGATTFGGTQHLAELSISGGSAKIANNAQAVVVTNTFSLTGSMSSFNVNNNALLVHNANVGALTTQVDIGRAFGMWNGSGISSGSAHYNAAGTTGLGILSGSDYLTLHGAGAKFHGQTVAASDALIGYTYNGDADLDGTITLADYALIDAGFLFNAAGGSWLTGDFDYSGTVDWQDYALIDSAFSKQGSPLAAEMISQHAAEFGADYLAAINAAVPEPASAALLIGGVALALRRRGRARRG